MNIDYKLNLRKRRKSAGLTQSALAKAVNLSRATIASSESGAHIPSFNTLKKLSCFLWRRYPGIAFRL